MPRQEVGVERKCESPTSKNGTIDAGTVRKHFLIKKRATIVHAKSWRRTRIKKKQPKVRE